MRTGLMAWQVSLDRKVGWLNPMFGSFRFGTKWSLYTGKSLSAKIYIAIENSPFSFRKVSAITHENLKKTF